jgi:hypothetical protein
LLSGLRGILFADLIIVESKSAEGAMKREDGVSEQLDSQLLHHRRGVKERCCQWRIAVTKGGNNG